MLRDLPLMAVVCHCIPATLAPPGPAPGNHLNMGASRGHTGEVATQCGRKKFPISKHQPRSTSPAPFLILLPEILFHVTCIFHQPNCREMGCQGSRIGIRADTGHGSQLPGLPLHTQACTGGHTQTGTRTRAHAHGHARQ